MNAFWTTARIEAAVSGDIAKPPPEGKRPFGAAIDTRAITPGQVFFALKGDNTDGHEFVQAAADAGSPLAIVERSVEDADIGQIVVEDTRQALKNLARAWRRAHETIRIVAVTGSNGKTTTVRLIDSLLRTGGLKGHRAPKSFNNDLGVPITLLNAPSDADYVVCEIGMNTPGEIAPLSRIVRPNLCVITSIGRAHLGRMGSIAAIAKEKASILTGIREGGTFVYPADSEPLREAVDDLGPMVAVQDRPVFFGESCLEAIEPGDAGTRFRYRDKRFDVALPGEHNAANAAMAIEVARAFNIPDDAIREGLAAVTPPAGRLERVRVTITKDTTASNAEIIDDSYNANPDSMAAALRWFGTAKLSDGTSPTRRIAVLGEMLELGDEGPDAHREIGAIASTNNIDHAVFVGRMGLFCAERVSKDWSGEHYTIEPEATDAAIERIANLIEPGDLVLLKGSRLVRLERVRHRLVGPDQHKDRAQDIGSNA